MHLSLKIKNTKNDKYERIREKNRMEKKRAHMVPIYRILDEF
jgi:hypothetical protein